MIGTTISHHYRIVGQIGAGGMGVVYRADDLRLGRSVALKFLSDDLVKDQQAIRRLRSEARAASALNHGNICTIFDIDEHEGQPFIVMELMRGRTLRDSLANGPLKIHQLIDIGIEIADALHAAHNQGIVHRDIKPGNIFLTELGHVKVLDFGLAKLTPRFGLSGTTTDEPDRTVAGVTRGTVAYMSPEQATGDELDARTDLFSLGVVLYECATGRHPFPGKTSAVILAAILHRAPVAPIALNAELPLRLQEVINTCLEKDRELRYQSAADIRADLKRVRRDIESGPSRAVDVTSSAIALGAKPSNADAIAAPSPVVSTPTSTRGPSRRLMIAAAVAGAAILAVGAYRSWPRAAAPPPDDSRITAFSEATIRSRLDLAQATLAARKYREALAYATEVLALDPGHVGAQKIRDQARATLERMDAAIADANRRTAAGDLDGAARALETARAIDPTAPDLSDLSARVDAQMRARDAARATPRGHASPSLSASARRAPVDAVQRPERSPARGTREPQPATADLSPPPPATARAETPATTPPPATPIPASPPPGVPAPRVEPVAPPPTAAAPPPPAATEPKARETPPSPPAVDDATAIRSVTTLYARAIETKDLTLFRSIKPNLSRDEERRLQEGFRAVTAQRVALTILSIDVRGTHASVVLRRRDTIQAGGQQHTAESQQTLTLARTSTGWVIVEIR
ncbi:MAG: hypothetical protein DMF85_19140 [Acidobacteria bacterium]|nr:MAG: hypothetical protein DMF85_19140 [Acidobacteriota bacterium]